MSATCKFCRRIFSSPQGVRAHLKTCQAYQQAKMAPPKAEMSPKAALRVPQPRLPKASQPLRQAHPIGISKIADVAHDDFTRHRYQLQQDERQRFQEEQVEKGKRRREIVQQIKASVIDWHFLWDDVPVEAKAKAKIEIERQLASLPVLELPMSELRQIGEGIRDQIYTPYLKTIQERKQVREEVSKMAKRILLTGVYICPKCEMEYELDREPEDEAVCDKCEVPLEQVDEDQEPED